MKQKHLEGGAGGFWESRIDDLEPHVGGAGEKSRHRLILWALAAFFVLRVLRWAMADLWYDEILSLQYFVFGRTLPEIFRDYSIANNHFLCNAVERIYVLVSFFFYPVHRNELLLRLPSIAFGCLTVVTIGACWRRWLGRKLSLIVALLMVASPVFSGFAYQMRGYSLAMFLATVSVTLSISRRDNPTFGNALWLFAVSAMLPLVMPTAVVVPMALSIAFLLPVVQRGSGARFLDAVRRALPTILGGILGLSYYLTLWVQFMANRRTSGGWESRLLVFLHLALAFGCHLGILLLPAIRRRRFGDRFALCLAYGSTAVILLFLVLPTAVGRAPFPRVFLPLLPLYTLAAALSFKANLADSGLGRLTMKKLAFWAVAPGILLGIGGDILTGIEMDYASEPPQNLLQSYYRGSSDVSAWTRLIASRIDGADSWRYGITGGWPQAHPEVFLNFSGLPKANWLLVDPYDSTAFNYYSRLMPRITTYRNLEAPVLSQKALDTWLGTYFKQGLSTYYLARNEKSLRSAMEFVGLAPDDFEIRESERYRHRVLYRLTPIAK